MKRIRPSRAKPSNKVPAQPLSPLTRASSYPRFRRTFRDHPLSGANDRTKKNRASKHNFTETRTKEKNGSNRCFVVQRSPICIQAITRKSCGFLPTSRYRSRGIFVLCRATRVHEHRSFTDFKDRFEGSRTTNELTEKRWLRSLDRTRFLRTLSTFLSSFRSKRKHRGTGLCRKRLPSVLPIGG